jgi:hypothetical protein
MRALSELVAVFGYWFIGVGGCAPIVDSSAVGDAACSGGARLCGDICVTPDQPEYGCGDVSCNPCDFPDEPDAGFRGNAEFGCKLAPDKEGEFRCELSRCLDGFTGPRCEENTNLTVTQCSNGQAAAGAPPKPE